MPPLDLEFFLETLAHFNRKSNRTVSVLIMVGTIASNVFNGQSWKVCMYVCMKFINHKFTMVTLIQIPTPQGHHPIYSSFPL